MPRRSSSAPTRSWSLWLRPARGKAEAFARKHGIPHHFTDYRRLLEMEEIDLVVIGVPNDLHCQVTLAAAAAGQAYRAGETDVPEPGGGRPDARGLPPGQGQADVC